MPATRAASKTSAPASSDGRPAWPGFPAVVGGRGRWPAAAKAACAFAVAGLGLITTVCSYGGSCTSWLTFSRSSAPPSCGSGCSSARAGEPVALRIGLAEVEMTRSTFLPSTSPGCYCSPPAPTATVVCARASRHPLDAMAPWSCLPALAARGSLSRGAGPPAVAWVVRHISRLLVEALEYLVELHASVGRPSERPPFVERSSTTWALPTRLPPPRHRCETG